MRTMILKNCSSEIPPPGCVVHSVVSIKGHPVIHKGFIIRTPQCGISCLIGQSEYPRRCRTAGHNICPAGYKICLKCDLPVLINVKMLVRQIRLHIVAANVLIALLFRCHTVSRLPFRYCPLTDQLDQFLRLRIRIRFPAVIGAVQSQLYAESSHKLFLFPQGIILFGLLLHKRPDRFLVQHRTVLLHSDPVL